MKLKVDDEIFDQVEARTCRCWTETELCPRLYTYSIRFTRPGVTLDCGAVQGLPCRQKRSARTHPPLAALCESTDQSEIHTLPLTSTLLDMKSDTASYITCSSSTRDKPWRRCRLEPPWRARRRRPRGPVC